MKANSSASPGELALAHAGDEHAVPASSAWLTRVSRPWLGYVVAVAGTALTAIARSELQAIFGPGLPNFSFFYGASVLSAVIGGAGPGLLATALASVTASLLFCPPAGSFALSLPGDRVGLVLFWGVNIVVSFVCQALQTARVRTAEEAHRAEESERRLRATFHQAAVGIIEAGEDDRFIAVNNRICEMLGYEPHELIGRTAHEITHPEDRSTSVITNQELRLNRKTRISYEKRYLKRDGTPLWVHVTVTSVTNERGKWIRTIATVEDISDRRAVEETLRAEKMLTDAVINSLPGIFLLLDSNQRFVRFNQNLLQITGQSESGLRELRALDLVLPEDRPQTAAAIDAVLKHGEGAVVTRLISKDGKAVPYSFTGRRFRFDGMVGLVAIGLDISERLQAENEARAALKSAQLERQRLAAVLETLPAGVAIADAAGKITHFNPALERIWGGPPIPRSSEEYRSWRGRWAHNNQPLRASDWAMARALRNGEVVPGDVVEIDKFDGSGTATIINAAAPIKSDDGRIIGGVVAEIDISAQTRAERALRDSEGKFRALAQTIPQMVWTTDAAGDVDYTNQRWLDFTGQSANQALGSGWVAALHPEDRPATLESWSKAAAAGSEFQADYRLRNTQGEYRWFLARAIPLRDTEGRIHRWVGTSTDIDEHRRTLQALRESEQRLSQAKEELATANAHLEQKVRDRTAKLQETVSELEGFSYSLVHDMRAPLRAMQTYAAILEEETGPSLEPSGLDFLRKIKIAASRMDKLVTDSLNYSRLLLEALPLGTVEVASLIRGLVDTYPNLQEPGASIRIEFDRLEVKANEAALTQVFSNLLGNAVKFVAPGVKPMIRVTSKIREPGSDERNGGPVTLGARVAVITVEDNGIGIPREAQHKIFGMFQRLHRTEEYPGTGIGLALVRKSLERIGGSVCVESEPGHGSKFAVTLPLPNASSGASPRDKKEEPAGRA